MDDRTRTRQLPDGSTLRVNFHGEQKPAKKPAKKPRGKWRVYVEKDGKKTYTEKNYPTQREAANAARRIKQETYNKDWNVTVGVSKAEEK